jgi:hypothetical protein
MRAVAVAVVRAAAVDRVVAGDGAPAELGVVEADAGVDDVRLHARTGPVVGVRAGQRQVPLVDPVETPRRTALGGQRGDGLVCLDVRHARVSEQSLDSRQRQRGGEALQRVAVLVADRRPVPPGLVTGGTHVPAGRVVPEHDDVAATGRRGRVGRRTGKEGGRGEGGGADEAKESPDVMCGHVEYLPMVDVSTDAPRVTPCLTAPLQHAPAPRVTKAAGGPALSCTWQCLTHAVLPTPSYPRPA